MSGKGRAKQCQAAAPASDEEWQPRKRQRKAIYGHQVGCIVLIIDSISLCMQSASQQASVLVEQCSKVTSAVGSCHNYQSVTSCWLPRHLVEFAGPSAQCSRCSQSGTATISKLCMRRPSRMIAVMMVAYHCNGYSARFPGQVSAAGRVPPMSCLSGVFISCAYGVDSSRRCCSLDCDSCGSSFNCPWHGQLTPAAWTSCYSKHVCIIWPVCAAHIRAAPCTHLRRTVLH